MEGGREDEMERDAGKEREMDGGRKRDGGREDEMEMERGIMSIAVAETLVTIGQALDQTLKHIYQHPH